MSDWNNTDLTKLRKKKKVGRKKFKWALSCGGHSWIFRAALGPLLSSLGRPSNLGMMTLEKHLSLYKMHFLELYSSGINLIPTAHQECFFFFLGFRVFWGWIFATWWTKKKKGSCKRFKGYFLEKLAPSGHIMRKNNLMSLHFGCWTHGRHHNKGGFIYLTKLKEKEKNFAYQQCFFLQFCDVSRWDHLKVHLAKFGDTQNMKV